MYNLTIKCNSTESTILFLSESAAHSNDVNNKKYSKLVHDDPLIIDD